MGLEKGVYAGSFDPITNGHLWVIKESRKLFKELIVAIGIDPKKDYTFPLNERIKMLKETTKRWKNVKITTIDNKFLVNYTESIGAQCIIRGIRNQKDYEYERGMRNTNSDLAPKILTVFLMPPREIAEISSSLVKELIGPEGWQEIIKRYVPGPVYKSLMERGANHVAG